MSDPLPSRIVPFYSDEIVAVQRPDGTIFVLFARLCENLGLSRWTQSRRVQNHAVLSTGLVSLLVETPGGPQEVHCLRLDLLPLWLAGVPARKVDEAIKEKLIRYQTEAARRRGLRLRFRPDPTPALIFRVAAAPAPVARPTPTPIVTPKKTGTANPYGIRRRRWLGSRTRFARHPLRLLRLCGSAALR